MVFLLLLLLMAGSACGDDLPLVERSHDLDDWSKEGPQLRETLQRHMSGGIEGLVTEPIEAGDLRFDRVGLMFDAKKTPRVSARLSLDGGRTFTDWMEVTITFREGIAHNAHVDVPAGGSHIQVRFTGVEPEDLSFLFIDAFVYDPDPVMVHSSEETLDVLHQEIAADEGVDVTRSQWSARSTQCTFAHTPYRMTIHHTVTPNDDSMSMPARMRQMQNFHMDSRGYCDIGYHFCIGQDGKVYQGRPEGLRGAHVGGANTGNAGISFIGTYSNVVPSDDMMQAGAKIIWAVADYYGIAINRDRVKGHREYSSTECPGNALYPKMDELVAMAQAYPENGGTTPTQGVLRGAIYHGDDLQDLSMRISGASVSLDDGQSTTTDGEGWYAFDVDAGSYTVTASASGFSTESISRDVSAGSTTWGSIRLYPQAGDDEGTVRGVVFWVDDPAEYWDYVGDASRRLSGATVTFSPGGHSATTSSDGYYEIELPVGDYEIQASAEGYEDGTHPEGVTVTSGALVWGSTPVIRPGEDDEVPPPSISLTDPPDGAEVKLASIKVSGTVNHSADLVEVAINEEPVDVEDGSFETLVHLSEGENVIVATAEDELGQMDDDQITIVFDPPSGGIDGFVYDVSVGDEARIEGAAVTLSDIDDEVVTGETGAFSLDLDSGTYILEISAEGFIPHRGAVTVVPGRRLNLRIGLEPGTDRDEDLVEFVFPTDEELLLQPSLIVMAAAADPDLSWATINEIEAELGEEGQFSAEITLEPGENVLEAVAYRTGDEEIGRSTITVYYESGGCGCSAPGSSTPSTFMIAAMLMALIFFRRRR